ncbi:MAG: ferredoxin [Eubacteriaceae bacterium]
MEVLIKDGCISCELCTETCPEEFEMGPEGTAVVIHEDVPTELEDSVGEAADQCPVSVIEIED